MTSSDVVATMDREEVEVVEGGYTEGVRGAMGAPSGASRGGVEVAHGPAPTLFKPLTAKDRAVPGFKLVMSVVRSAG